MMSPATLAGLLAVWFILDCIITHQGLTKRGMVEMNGWLSRFMREWGVPEALAFSKFIALVAVWMATAKGEFDGPAVWVLVALHAAYALLIAWNVYQFLKAGKGE